VATACPAENANRSGLDVDGRPVEAGELAHTEPGGVEELEDRAVAEPEETIRRRRGEQAIDLVERQVHGELLPGLRRRDAERRVRRELLRADEEAEEAAHGGELPRDRGTVGLAVERAQPVADGRRAHAGDRAGAREELTQVGEIRAQRVR
jgi:hypothetical protein